MQSDSSEYPAMVPVARFNTREQAESFHAIAAECGVAARILDHRRFSGGFDSTLGGADSLQGFIVEVGAGEVTALAAHLEAGMEIDPQDPMHWAGREELTAIVEGPMDGNLCERIIAARILAGLPPEKSHGVCGEPAVVDAWLAADGRTARWLGSAGLIFTAIYLTVIADRVLYPDYWYSVYEETTHSWGLNPSRGVTGGEIADNVRPYLLILMPMAAGAALILSWRQLRDGTRRRMFPDFWRRTGYLLFWLPPAVLTAGTGLVPFYREVRHVMHMLGW